MTSARQVIAADVEEGVCLVPGCKIPGRNSAASLTERNSVELTADESVIRIHCRSANFQLAGMPVVDYPELPELLKFQVP